MWFFVVTARSRFTQRIPKLFSYYPFLSKISRGPVARERTETARELVAGSLEDSIMISGAFKWSVATLAFVGSVLVLGGCDGGNQSEFIFEDNGFPSCTAPRTGCACTPGQVMACYPEEPLLDESGEPYCMEGFRVCGGSGIWGECDFPEDAERYAIIGDPELCGGCDPACWRVHDCPTGRDLNEDNADNVRFDLDADGIVLGGTLFNARYAFIANAGSGQVSKIDLTSRTVVGQYRLGFSPSRTAIDSRGNAYVAHRRGSGYVSKIAGDTSYCVDRNMNGTIETSHSITPLPSGTIDECVIWNRKIVDHAHSSGSGFRAVTIDRVGRVWLGEGDWAGYADQYFHVLDPNTGSPVHAPVRVNFQAYGAAVGGDGNLWFTTREYDYCGGSGVRTRHIQSINTDTFAVGPAICDPYGSHYGIAVDRSNRVWVANWGQYRVSRYDPLDQSWMHVVLPGRTHPRGVTIDSAGNIWTSDRNAAIRFDAETGGSQTIYNLPGCSTAIGIGADFSDNIWVSCHGSGNAIWLDPDTGDTVAIATGSGPYTYSDFTGFLRATVTSPEGSYTRLHDSRVACSGDRETYWSQLYWDVATPEGTQINFWARTAERIEHLGVSPEMLLATIPGELGPADIAATLTRYGMANNQRYMEIRVELRSLDGDSSPVFRNMDNVFYCVCNCDTDTECQADCDCDEDCGAGG
jgi:streptogramin lyase